MGGGGGIAPLPPLHDFGRSVKPIPISGVQIIPTTLLLIPRIFRPSYGPGTGYQNETFVCLKAGYLIKNSSQIEIKVTTVKEF